MEAEYVGGSAVVQEGIWLRRFLREFGIVAHAQEPITINCDSSVTIAYSKDPRYHEKIKHIGIRYHFVRHMIAGEEVILRHDDDDDFFIKCGCNIFHIEAPTFQ